MADFPWNALYTHLNADDQQNQEQDIVIEWHLHYRIYWNNYCHGVWLKNTLQQKH